MTRDPSWRCPVKGTPCGVPDCIHGKLLEIRSRLLSNVRDQNTNIFARNFGRFISEGASSDGIECFDYPVLIQCNHSIN